MRALATWCFHHRKTVLGLWLGVLIVLQVISQGVGSAYDNSGKLPNTESAKAVNLIQRYSSKVSGDQEQLVFGTANGAKVTDVAIRSSITTMLDTLSSQPDVTRIDSPFGPQARARISADQTVGFATVTFDKQADKLSKRYPKRYLKLVRSIETPDLKVADSGRLGELTAGNPLGGTSLLGVLLAGVVLFVVFGSVFAMLLPLLSALFALVSALALIGLISNGLQMPQFAPELVLLVGLGVGVDYALFIVTRHRQGLIAGKSPEESAVTAANTSGRAVLFAGIIVCIALLGMFAVGVSFLYGLAVAAAIGVAFTMIAALTLIPAMLGFIGHRVLSGKQRRYLDEHGPRVVGSSGFWKNWATTVQDRPWVSGASALLVIALVAAPFLGGMRLGASDDGNNPKKETTRQAYDLLAKGFGPGFNGPLQVVGLLTSPQEKAAFAKTVDAVRVTPGVAATQPLVFLPTPDGKTLAFTIAYASTAPQDKATEQLINHLRHDVIPQNKLAGMQIYIGGQTAIFHDFAQVIGQKLPIFIGIVVLMSFLLLVVVFRSIVVPATAAVMNLLSAGAAFGMLVAVFQWGWLGSLIGVSRTGPIDPFLPVMLFAILFGLSMDYEVFLISRMHEEWVKSGDNRTAVRNGLATTGKTISAAALIMILVFGAFILGGERVIKEFGLGLAGGIFMDAIIIRGAVIPAVMQLIGKANWWLPSWLDRRIPVVHVDGAEEQEALAVEPLAEEAVVEEAVVEETPVAKAPPKKAPAKAPAVKKAATKAAPVKKAPAKSAAPAKKAPAKKVAAKKAATKRS